MSTPGFGDHLPPAGQEENPEFDSLVSGDGDPEALQALIEIGIHPDAFPRQLMAILSSGDRQNEVRTINVPTLVLHGEEDSLIPVEHGKFTSELINGSRYITYPGMGHNFPPEMLPKILVDMISHFNQLSS